MFFVCLSLGFFFFFFLAGGILVEAEIPVNSVGVSGKDEVIKRGFSLVTPTPTLSVTVQPLSMQGIFSSLQVAVWFKPESRPG